MSAGVNRKACNPSVAAIQEKYYELFRGKADGLAGGEGGGEAEAQAQ